MNKKSSGLILSPAIYSRFEQEYRSNLTNTILRHSLVLHSIDDITRSADSPETSNAIYSIELKTMKAQNQRSSGRCWIFSATNLLREIIGKKLNVDQFELSQNFIAFYDKLEKYNFLLTELEKNIDEKHDERLNQKLLSDGVGDGGQWGMFVAIVKKYGLCPKSLFDDTMTSGSTLSLNKLINSSARYYAAQIHKLHEIGKDEEIKALHENYVEKVYNLLCSTFGVPPSTFNFEYKDNDNIYHYEKNTTPIEFFNKYIGNDIDDYISIINAPTKDKEYGNIYTIDHLGNVIEAPSIRHLNLPLKRIENLIIQTLKDGEPVWFGSDVSYYKDRNKGIWDDNLFDYYSAFGMDFSFNKKDMLDFYQSSMNHAMLITGVTLDENEKPLKWKIENSWGTELGKEGYFLQSESWFEKFFYQAVIKKKYLNEEEKENLKKEPIHLPLWDPFGTLAD